MITKKDFHNLVVALSQVINIDGVLVKIHGLKVQYVYKEGDLRINPTTFKIEEAEDSIYCADYSTSVNQTVYRHPDSFDDHVSILRMYDNVKITMNLREYIKLRNKWKTSYLKDPD